MLARRRLAARVAAASSLILAVAAGCAWMTSNGAPARYAAVNAAALAIGLASAFGLSRLSVRTAAWLAVLTAPTLAGLALAVGPDVDGVRRWIELGGMTFHAAMLGGPLFAVAASRAPGDWLTGVAGAVLALLLALQPDFATALALVCAFGSIGLIKPRLPIGAALLAAVVAALWTYRGSPSLGPVEFVEGVVQRLLADADALSIATLASLGLAVIAPAFTLPARRGGLALSAWMAGLVVASLLGPYPTPLVGYGAAAIVGYALALGPRDRGNT